MKLGRGSGIALIAAMCAIVLALFLVPIRTFADEENAAETVASAAATATPSTADSTETAGSSTDSTSAKTAADTSSELAATDASSSSSAASSDSSSSLSASAGSESSSSSAAGQGSSDSAATALAAQILASPLTATGGITIQYDTDTEIHHVDDPESANGRIILYCMNNFSHWPHTTLSIPTVPSYIEGYLTPEKFKSQADYDACMNKLLAILYAGYPYNGLNMYTIVDSTTGITEDQFNALLNPPSWIRTDFPDSIGDTVFSYSDYPDNTANLGKLSQFVQDELFKYYFTGATTPSGHTSAEIRATPFYQAAVAMAYASGYNKTPLKVWDQNHSDADRVTESEAYNATQYAIWAVLGDYGIENNTLNSKSGEVTQKALAVKLLNYATAEQVLQAEPDASKVKITGDSQFAYDPEYGVWKTGTLSVSEGENYHGMYTLTLPSGVSAHLLDGTPVSTVSAGTSFYLVSTTKPTATDMAIKVSDTLTWLKEYRQYSPSPENATASDGKNFQHMIGAVIKQKQVNATLVLKPANEGSLTVSKSVVGETNSATDFTFTVTLGNKNINGKYGDMTFKNGEATVQLKAGKSATAEHLPAGTTYTVAETANPDYSLSAKAGDTGTIAKDETATASFTNTRLYKLTVSKTVSGTANASSDQEFPIVITLKDANGDNVSDAFKYTGSVADSGSANKPADGSLTFVDGKATINLKAGQKIALSGIPSGYSYSVSEDNVTDDVYDDNDASHTSYAVTGTDSGRLDSDASVTITNTVRTGSLTVKKQVTKEVNPTSSFRIKVTLTGAGTGLSGTYGAMTFNEGIAAFDLKNNESITATGLPEGTTYTVEENSYDDYTTTYAGNNGTIGVGTDSVVTVTNERKPIALPLTGSDGVGPTYLAGIAALAAAAVWMHIRRNASVKGGDGRD
ncbi:MAG: DUF5979 domain-containing protein [Olsenella sp.]|nr:DUF5979 domain-containing protein [Olsenella sp.]